MDSVVIQAMIIELADRLSGSRVDRIVQPAAGTLVFKLWTGRVKCQLVLRGDAQSCFYLSERSFLASATPPRFCQLLRARLRRLISVSAEPLDRIVYFRFAGPDQVSYDLILELIGARGNLVLVDENGRIVDLLWRQSGDRLLFPGRDYQLPRSRQTVSWQVPSTEFDQRLHQANAEFDQLHQKIAPMSPALAQAIDTELATGKTLAAIFAELRQSMESRSFSPCHVHWQGHSGVLPFSYGLQGFDSVERADSLSTAIEPKLRPGQKPTGEAQSGRLRQVLRRTRKKLKRRLAMIAEDEVRHASPEDFRIAGELLLSNLHRIKRGADQIEVDDFYCDPPGTRVIVLDSEQTPQQNAEAYFRRYRKAKRGGAHHHRRRQETEMELEWLDQVELALDEARSADELYTVQSELEAAGLFKPTMGHLGRRRIALTREQLHTTISPCGRRIFWGRNNRTNDFLTREETGPDDLWMHAHNMPGCHLVLKTGGHPERVSEEDVEFAASLAAGYSKGKGAGKVEVMIASGKAVRKPKGARPGLVTVDQYRTVVVTPRRLDDQ